MATQLIDEDRLKELLKSALVEVLIERKDLVRDVIEETLEDISLTRAIEEGEHTKTVTREEVNKKGSNFHSPAQPQRHL